MSAGHLGTQATILQAQTGLLIRNAIPANLNPLTQGELRKLDSRLAEAQRALAIARTEIRKAIEAKP